MLTDITIGQMYPANSVVHRLDARFKIVFTIVFVVMLFLANTIGGMAVNILFVLIAYITIFSCKFISSIYYHRIEFTAA